jgi:glucosamine--fructose-6-phosphate aminotransferase (isomerizing)
VFVLDGAHAGELDGCAPLAYDGSELPIDDRDVATAQVTTRDIDRGEAPHFLLKEINEAPVSFRKTLRGKIVERRRGCARSSASTLPPAIAARLAAARSPRSA